MTSCGQLQWSMGGRIQTIALDRRCWQKVLTDVLSGQPPESLGPHPASVNSLRHEKRTTEWRDCGIFSWWLITYCNKMASWWGWAPIVSSALDFPTTHQVTWRNSPVGLPKEGGNTSLTVLMIWNLRTSPREIIPNEILSFDLSSDKQIFVHHFSGYWRERKVTLFLSNFLCICMPILLMSCFFFSPLKFKHSFPPTQRIECQVLFSDQLLMWCHLLPMKHDFKESNGVAFLSLNCSRQPFLPKS